jgi:hypothetical protein
MRINAGLGDLVRRIRDDQAQVGYSVARRSGGWVTPRARERDEKHGFSGLASKLVVMVCQWFGLKTTTMVSWFGPQNQGQRFDGLGLKITAMGSWFGPQNQVGGDLSVCASKPMKG